jgi:hypothetical protein
MRVGLLRSFKANRFTSPSSLAVAMVQPSGLNATELTACPWPTTSEPRGTGVWAATSHSFTVAVPATARRRPSGLQATESTETSLASRGKPAAPDASDLPDSTGGPSHPRHR